MIQAISCIMFIPLIRDSKLKKWMHVVYRDEDVKIAA